MSAGRTFRFLFLTFTVMTLSLAAGCRSIGPGTLDRDQLDYGKSVGDNWKNQMLANIVKLRYADMPVFVDVGSIVSGYSLETAVNARVGFSDSFTGGDSQGLGAGGRFTDRPTITYIPKTGDDYLRSLLTPVEPRSVLALIQVGYNAELLFTWSLEAINGVHNYSVTKNRSQSDPEFHEFTQLIRTLQNDGVVGWEFETDPVTQDDVLLVLRQQTQPEQVFKRRERVAEILGLDSKLERYRVVFAPFKVSSDTLAMQTRSILQMLSAMAGFIDVPAELSNHALDGFEVRSDTKRPFHVNSGKDKPDSSYAAVRYGNYWYWIDDTDLESKKVFVLMLFLTTLTNRSDPGIGPVLTIPTG